MEARRLRSDAERNRRRIVDAARVLFAARGLEATLHDVAKEAGVGVGTVYRRYPNKDALIDELFAERVEELIATAEDACAHPEAWQGLVAFLDRSTELLASDLGLKALVLGSPHARERVTTARERLTPLVGELVARAQADGSLRGDVEPADIALVRLMLSGVVDATHGMRPDAWRRALALVLDGLRTRRDAPAELPGRALAPADVDAAISTAVRAS